MHGVTTRAGGASTGPYAALNIGRGCGDDPGAVAANRDQLARQLGFPRLETPRQVHGKTITSLDGKAALPASGCDGLLVSETDLLVGVLGADCPGVLLVAPEHRALAVVHAGWRGVAAGIVRAALDGLVQRHGVAPADLHVGIGPGISGTRYEVSAEVADEIRAALEPQAHDRVLRTGRPGHAHADLPAAIHAQLTAAGVAPERIETHGACTWDDERFFSHRRDAGRTGRHALVAGWS